MVIGAGADVSFNLPTVPQIVRELAEFTRTDGKPVSAALRAQLGRLWFSFERAAGEGGDELIARLFEDPEDALPSLAAIRSKLGINSVTGPVAEALEVLGTMASGNRVSPELAERLAKSTGASSSSGAGDTFLDPRRLALTPLVRTAIRQGLEQALMSVGEFTEKEREFLDELVADTTNIENLLSLYFGRFTAVGRFAERRTYLYIAWMLWAFLQMRSASATRPAPCFYDVVKRLRLDVITFNYTDFLGRPIGNQIISFHGRLDQYLRADDRSIVSDDPRLGAVVDAKSAVAFIEGLRLNTNQYPAIDLPAIVPPLTFKPLLSRNQLLAWSAADALLQKARVVVIVGYSFAQVDEHFNDLLRKGNPNARVVIVNPDMTAVAERACAVLGLDARLLGDIGDSLGRPSIQSGRLTCVNAVADALSEDELRLHLA